MSTFGFFILEVSGRDGEEREMRDRGLQVLKQGRGCFEGRGFLRWSVGLREMLTDWASGGGGYLCLLS